jgi:hypothetical protein
MRNRYGLQFGGGFVYGRQPGMTSGDTEEDYLRFSSTAGDGNQEDRSMMKHWGWPAKKRKFKKKR